MISPPGKGPAVSVKLFRFLQSENKLYDAVREPRRLYFVFILFSICFAVQKKKQTKTDYFTRSRSPTRARQTTWAGGGCADERSR